MSKEMLKQTDEWLSSMYDLLSLKTDEEDRAYTQKRIDLFNWLIWRAETLQEIIDAWIDIEGHGTEEEADDFYTTVQNILGGGVDE